MEIIDEHGNIFPIQSHQAKPLEKGVPSVAAIWKAATQMMLMPVPPKGAGHVVTSDDEFQGLRDLLRAQGPLMRNTVRELLDEEGDEGERIIRAALRKKDIFIRRTYRRDTLTVGVLMLLPQAATSVARSFKIDWHWALGEFCTVYDAFSMESATRHLGLGGHHRVIHDNAGIVKELLRAHGFAETEPGMWARATPVPRAAPILGASRETFHDQIVATVTQGGLMRRREIEQRVAATRKQMDRILRELVAEGILVRVGSGSSTAYMSPGDS